MAPPSPPTPHHFSPSDVPDKPYGFTVDAAALSCQCVSCRSQLQGQTHDTFATDCNRTRTVSPAAVTSAACSISLRSRSEARCWVTEELDDTTLLAAQLDWAESRTHRVIRHDQCHTPRLKMRNGWVSCRDYWVIAAYGTDWCLTPALTDQDVQDDPSLRPPITRGFPCTVSGWNLHGPRSPRLFQSSRLGTPTSPSRVGLGGRSLHWQLAANPHFSRCHIKIMYIDSTLD